MGLAIEAQTMVSINMQVEKIKFYHFYVKPAYLWKSLLMPFA